MLVDWLGNLLDNLGLLGRHWCSGERKFGSVVTVLVRLQKDSEVDEEKRGILAHFSLKKWTRDEYRAPAKYVNDDYTVNDKDTLLLMFEDVARKHGDLPPRHQDGAAQVDGTAQAATSRELMSAGDQARPSRPSVRRDGCEGAAVVGERITQQLEDEVPEGIIPLGALGAPQLDTQAATRSQPTLAPAPAQTTSREGKDKPSGTSKAQDALTCVLLCVCRCWSSHRSPADCLTD